MPVLLGLAGGAVDLYVYTNHQKQLQNVADSAALAAAREAALEGWSQQTAQAVVDHFVQSNIRETGGGSAVYTALAEVDRTNRRVSVSVEQDHYGYFIAGYFKSSPQIRVTAVAQASGSTNICVIGLSGDQGNTIGLNSNATLSAPKCAVYSNSNDRRGLVSKSNSLLTAALACSAGGVEGQARNFNKPPLTDCPVMEDPLASRPPPKVKPGCMKTHLILNDYVGVILPGTYCGGLHINANSRVTMLPGIYVMKDGPFIVDSNSIVTGKGVGIYFTGNRSYFLFNSNVEVSLEAPVIGEMAGLIFYQDRSAPVTQFTITSNYTRNLLGTIYLPKGDLLVNAVNDVADQSAYTAIVVNRLMLNSAPRVVLNTDYDKTDVPVPDGLGPESGKTRLVR